MVFTRKTKLYCLPGIDILTLTKNLNVASDSRGWKQVTKYLKLDINEVRMCELGGGAAPVVELMQQRGWTLGKTIDVLKKMGNVNAVNDLSAILTSDPTTSESKMEISGETCLTVGGTLSLTIDAPPLYSDIQWYFNTTCLRCEKSRALIIRKVNVHHQGRYKARLEANPNDVKWLFVDISVQGKDQEQIDEGTSEELRFVMQPQDFMIKENGAEAHFFVDVKPEGGQYQWFADDLVIHGAINPYLCVSNLNQDAHRRQFKCAVSLNGRTIISNVALVRWVPEAPSDLTASSFVETAADKVALIIGNQKYEEGVFGDIVHAEDDARDIAASLRQLQFKVVSLINLTRQEMVIAFENFYKLLSSGVYGVFYFAGHGFEFGGENYLIPVDASSNVRVENCIKAQFVLHRMQFRETKLNLLLLDMCRDQFTKAGVPGDIQPVRSFGNTAIGFACGPGFRAYGSENDSNGIYVKYLKEHIMKNITVTTLLDNINKDIGLKEPNINQRPHFQSSITKNISLHDPINSTGHTAEFQQRAVLWGMSNNLDKTDESIDVFGRTVKLRYRAAFSNVLLVSVDTAGLSINSVSVDQEHLTLLKISDGEYEVRNIQKLSSSCFLILFTFKDINRSFSVQIERPLFAKITSSSNNLGSVLNVDMYGSYRAGLCALPSGTKVRGAACLSDATLPVSDATLPKSDATVTAKKKPFEKETNENCSRESEDDLEAEKKAAQKLAKLKKFDDGLVDEEGDNNWVVHMPSPIINYNPQIIYPFVGIYILFNKDDTYRDMVEKIKREVVDSCRVQQAAKVTMETYLIQQETSAKWLEVIVREKEYGKTRQGLLEGRTWHNSNSKFSCHVISILNMLLSHAINNASSELWISDHLKFRQVLPSYTGLVIDDNPTTIPTA